MKVCSFLLWWQITGEKFLLSLLDQKLWVIQFYKVLYGNYWKFEMSDWEIGNISRMINCRNMKFSDNLSNNRIILKDLVFKIWFGAFTVSEILKMFRAKMTPPPRLDRVNMTQFHSFRKTLILLPLSFMYQFFLIS